MFQTGDRADQTKNAEFLRILKMKGPRAFSHFIHALVESHQKHIALRLDADLAAGYLLSRGNHAGHYYPPKVARRLIVFHELFKRPCVIKTHPSFAGRNLLLSLYASVRPSVPLWTKCLKTYWTNQLHFWWKPSLWLMEEIIRTIPGVRVSVGSEIWD